MAADVEIADLAALLAELKGRSGLSYGTLAKRLHLSPSTVHRYCKGEGLPPEFATVERFARQCGATAEELMELHRRWIAADTARERDRRAPEPEPAAVAPAAPVPAVAAVPPARRRWRPGAVVGAVAAATALTLAAGLLLALRDDDEDQAAQRQPPPAGDGPAPVAVTVRPHAFESPCGNHYLVDADPESVPPPPHEPEAPGWARAMGAVPAGRQYVELTIQGTGDETVVLRDLHVRVTRADEPLPWNLYTGYSACGGGPVDTAAFDVDLDAAAPALTAGADQSELPLWVDESDPLVVYVTARTEAHDVDWYLDLEWSSGDREGVLRIDDEGEPLRTSATSGQPEWGFLLGGTDWYPAPTG
ncbi:helix-turn-helix domain-containing protein [Streptomyces profundus]|uniref:helix-turn-helix domain-containing protein n=1 Tax=Streptomyces profundus TaxID=2867410 RepID=UPI001D16DBF0|nr:helix-turn-helix transcriptional regulator [Streptomyces sp. MA3_2.13]UED85678.1 helix-turn-helix domain-containing protein [Streptomyces sp. MA3_2.13]